MKLFLRNNIWWVSHGTGEKRIRQSTGQTDREQAEKVAAYKGLSPKGALHLRLLTEEMMGMMRSITGEKEGKF